MAKKAKNVGLPARLDFIAQALHAFEKEEGSVQIAQSDSALLIMLNGVMLCPNHAPEEARFALRANEMCSSCAAELLAKEKEDVSDTETETETETKTEEKKEKK